MNYISGNIKHLRGLKGLRQKELAAALGYGANTISNYENGKSNPNHNDLTVIADYFSVPVEMIIRDDLEKLWTTWEDVQKWKEKEKNKKEQAALNLQAVAVSPVWIETIKEHYTNTISKLTGQSQEDIQSQLNQLFYSKLSDVAAKSQ